jgi:hypothetical protein
MSNRTPSRAGYIIAARATVETLERRTLLSVKFQFDYTYDTQGFFSDPTRRSLLQLAADNLTSRLGDTLNAIVPGGGNSWSVTIVHPSAGNRVTINNSTLAADTIRVYVGGRSWSGGPAMGSASAELNMTGSDAWFATVLKRGEPGVPVGFSDPATDYAPNVSYLLVNSLKTWHLGTTTTGLGAGETDFLSAATHELGHIFGIGLARSWGRLTQSGRFTGTAAQASYGGSVPLESGFASAHWAEGTRSGGQEAAMDPTLAAATRKTFTALDFAALDDIGWELRPLTSPTASIAGTVYNDLDADGVKDSGEAGLASVRVFVDADKDGVFDSTEKSALTSSSGAYTITGLAAGSHRVRHVRPSGYRAVSPSAGYHTLTLTSGQASTGKNFADTQKVLIAGTVFNDLDADGTKDSGEAGLSGWRVFLDADRDAVFDSTERSVLTDSAGNYSFKTLAAGSYRVRGVLASGWRRTTPSSGYFDLTLSSGATATSKRFGFTQRILISGTVFNDANGDRAKNSGEVGLSGWRVFVDADADGVFDSTERSVLTDSSGNWSFKTLAAGTYRIRVVQQSGWSRTTPTAGYHGVTLSSGGTSTGKLFGQRRIA